MNKKQAAEQISNLFEHGFQRETYTHFLRNLLNDVEARNNHYSGNTVPDAFKQHVNQYWRIGKYIDPEDVEMDLYVVEVKSLSKLDRARTALRNFAVRTMQTFGDKDHALIAFYAKEDNGDDWRFSYVKIEHTAKLDEKRGKVKLEKELTPAKRYSFLVGEHENSHTAQAQLVDLLAMDYANPTVEEIEKSFSIEKVTKEFFEQYKDLFVRLSEVLAEQSHFQQESDETKRKQIVAKFAKKLLGQIVFLYFLQKKGWMGVGKDDGWGKGERRFLQKLFGDANEASQNYYVEKLQYLFYEALANDRKDQFDPSYYQRFDCRIPFLNGGLFEADYDWQKITVEIPNIIFSNDDKTKAGDRGTGILDVFDRYNFTIKEDEPLEKEVAVDPEMLGKVFENMLEITERKSKGAFYTPREIVHYMCQESLIHYLNGEVGVNTKTDIPKADIETLVRKGIFAIENDQRILEKGKETDAYTFKLPESIRSHAELIDDKLADIKICDPAIGSGAFPLGMLHEILHARQALAPHLPEEKRLRPYELKKHTIGHSIYGVDLDPSAIDIARLRLWLSLVVDEDDYTSIDALPNLDYKIMQGNSLIEEYEGVKLFDEHFIEPDNSEKQAKVDAYKVEVKAIQERCAELNRQGKLTSGINQKSLKDIAKKKENITKLNNQIKADQGENDLYDPKQKARVLEKLHAEFFSIQSPGEKRKKRDQITRIEWELIEATLGEQNKTNALAKLAEYKTSGEKPWFLWKLNFSEVFKQKGGFDIVIGNPPYVKVQSLDHALIDAYKRIFKTAWKRIDISSLFFEQGADLLRPQGTLSYICSNQFVVSEYGKKLRKFLLSEVGISEISDFGDLPVFENALTYVSIFLIQKGLSEQFNFRRILALPFDPDTVDFEQMRVDTLSDAPWTLGTSKEKEILVKIESVGSELRHYADCNYGIVSGKDPVFLFNRDLIENDEVVIEPECLVPLARAQDCSRYGIASFSKYIFYPYSNSGGKSKLLTEEELRNYPLAYKYITQHQAALEARKDSRKSYKGRSDWYSLTRFSSFGTIRSEKILYPGETKKNKFCIDTVGYSYSGARVFSIVPSDPNDLLFLLGILNSEVAEFYLHAIAPLKQGGYYSYSANVLKRLPVVARNMQSISLMAQYRNSLGTDDSSLQSSYFEQLIDGLVYELYFPEEIQTAGKEILPHLGELTPLTDEMSEEEKLAVIQREFERLYDPNHPVRNHLETLDSIEEVRIIREALKK